MISSWTFLDIVLHSFRFFFAISKIYIFIIEIFLKLLLLLSILAVDVCICVLNLVVSWPWRWIFSSLIEELIVETVVVGILECVIVIERIILCIILAFLSFRYLLILLKIIKIAKLLTHSILLLFFGIIIYMLDFIVDMIFVIYILRDVLLRWGVGQLFVGTIFDDVGITVSVEWLSIFVVCVGISNLLLIYFMLIVEDVLISWLFIRIGWCKCPFFMSSVTLFIFNELRWKYVLLSLINFQYFGVDVGDSCRFFTLMYWLILLILIIELQWVIVYNFL